MSISLVQIFLSLFLLFALSRVILRFRDGELTISGLIFWSSVFSLAIVIVLIPGLTSKAAQKLGIGRGVDAVVYTSIVVLFYLVFRLYVYLQDIKHEITSLIRKLALKEFEKKQKK